MADSARNTLFYGDNLDILRHQKERIPEESVDLIYLDPPFNSKRDYSVIFKEETGLEPESQVKAFNDTWKWTETTAHLWDEFQLEGSNQKLISLLEGLISTLGHNDVTAYLVNMAPRLMELRRVLKPTGSIYLHCDPTASHYLKIVMDQIFGAKHFCNEIIWWYRKWSASESRFLRNHDVILFYSRSANPKRPFTVQYVPLAESTLKRFGGKRQDFADDARTRKVTTEEDSKGSYMPDVWPISLVPAKLQLYPTQKPLKLLELIVTASSKPGDTVLDPFCGCGTTIMASQKLGRRWIGIDVTAIATSLIKSRLGDTFGLNAPTPPGKLRKANSGDYDVIGEPESEADARKLAGENKYEFQKWAISLVPRAQPWKKGADGGVDGILRFTAFGGIVSKVILSVKGGASVGVTEVRDLDSVVRKEKAQLGYYISLETATKPMREWATAQGMVTLANKQRVPVIQLRTVRELLDGHGFEPSADSVMFGSMPKFGSGQSVMDLLEDEEEAEDGDEGEEE